MRTQKVREAQKLAQFLGYLAKSSLLVNCREPGETTFRGALASPPARREPDGKMLGVEIGLIFIHGQT